MRPAPKEEECTGTGFCRMKNIYPNIENKTIDDKIRVNGCVLCAMCMLTKSPKKEKHSTSVVLCMQYACICELNSRD